MIYPENKDLFMVLTCLLLVILLWACFSRARAERVVKCHDGDTCTIQTKEGKYSLRLWGIDAPEIKQPYGVKSREYLKKLVLNKRVKVVLTGSGSWGRKVGRLYVGRKDVCSEMVKLGLAWDSPKYSKGKYSHQQNSAQKKRRGLWKDSNSQPPWDYRAGKRRKPKRRKGFLQRCFGWLSA